MYMYIFIMLHIAYWSEARSDLQENLQKQLSQERAAREVQQETLRVYLSQREVPVQALHNIHIYMGVYIQYDINIYIYVYIYGIYLYIMY